jgi:hypothetical protein
VMKFSTLVNNHNYSNLFSFGTFTQMGGRLISEWGQEGQSKAHEWLCVSTSSLRCP